ncbi:unnamed protein product, partial [Ixodes hexagonus]
FKAESLPTSEDSPLARSSRRRKIRRGKLPAPGERSPVVVVGADVQKKTLYVQELSVQDELLSTMKALNRAVVEEPQPPDLCAPGPFVAALREEDSTWYRARVHDVLDGGVHGAAQKGGSARVFYLDYGHWGTVPLDGLRRLPERFLDPRAFAVPVVLHAVAGLPSRAAASLQGKVLGAEVVVDERPQQVALFTVDDNECLNDVLGNLGR